MVNSDVDAHGPRACSPDPTTLIHRPPTSTDVARRAGVSQATVSYVLNDRPHSRVTEETRKRVRDAADELGYTPHAMARLLRAGHSNVVLLPQLGLPSGHEISASYDELATQLNVLGYTLIAHFDRSTRGVEAARVWASLRPAGILVEANRVSRRAIELLRIAGTQAIMVMDDAPSQLAPTIIVNEIDVAACAAEYLVSRGHKHVGVVVPREAGLVQLGLERLAGFARVGRTHGIEVERIDLAYDQGEAARRAAHWKNGSHPGAIFTYNDEYGMLVMRALLDVGIAIPGEIALVGADDLPFCALLRPQLTSVAKGQVAAIPAIAEMFDALIQGRMTDVTAIQLFRPRLVARESA